MTGIEVDDVPPVLASGGPIVDSCMETGRAAYWDGRNHAGESVGSAIYFYQLRAGDYSAIRKMVILQ